MTLTLEEKKRLLGIARKTLENRLLETSVSLPEPTETMERLYGAFVTLHKNGKLRGCIGHMTGINPLYRTVSELALSSALEDPRFPRVAADELREIDIEISVLSPLREVSSVEEIVPGVHGIYIQRGHRSGVLLPQVASERGWDRTTFLRNSCRKAGMDEKCWKLPDTRISIFEAEIFGELEWEKKGGGCFDPD